MSNRARTMLLFFIAVMAPFIISSAHAGKAKPLKSYDIKDLQGEYRYNLVEIRQIEVPGLTEKVVDYCDHNGTMVMDGSGNATHTEWVRCSEAGSEQRMGQWTYTVSPSGEVILIETTYNQVIHGQITLKGRMILVDGSLREPDVFVLQGVAAKP